MLTFNLTSGNAPSFDSFLISTQAFTFTKTVLVQLPSSEPNLYIWTQTFHSFLPIFNHYTTIPAACSLVYAILTSYHLNVILLVTLFAMRPFYHYITNNYYSPTPTHSLAHISTYFDLYVQYVPICASERDSRPTYCCSR